MSTPLDEYLQQRRGQFENDLREFLRIPSVSADSTHAGDMQAAANWMVQHFERLGLSVELMPTAGHPVVYAETPPVEGRSVALVYGHYDVQPPEPLDEWLSPPFEPTERDGNLYARGATDDKGQMLTHVKSVEAWLATTKKLPVQVKFLIEGEEEVGSPHLADFLHEHRQRLACNVVVISDTSQFGPRQPAITYGLRGIAYYELQMQGPKQDLHSGTFGGAVTNPAIALARMLTALIDDNGRIQVPGFYDQVVPLSEHEREQLAGLPFDEARFLEKLNLKRIGVSLATPLSNAVGRGRRSTSTVSPPATKAKGRRPCFPPGPAPSSASVSCPTKTRMKSPPRWSNFSLICVHLESRCNSPRRTALLA